MRLLVACWVTLSFLLASLFASDDFDEISFEHSNETRNILNSADLPFEYKSFTNDEPGVYEKHLVALFDSIMKGELSALTNLFTIFSAPETAHMMFYHWKLIKYLLKHPKLEVVECINELNSAESRDDYRAKSEALEARECIFEYLNFAVENEARFDTFSQDKEQILEILQIIIEQHRLPCMFKVLFAMAAPKLSSQEIGSLINFSVRESTFMTSNSVLPVNFELFSVFIKYAPAAFEEWLLVLFESESEYDFDWILFLPFYFAFCKREISPALHEYISNFSFDLSHEALSILDSYISASDFNELYTHVDDPNHAELEKTVTCFQFILSRFEASEKEQGIDLQLLVVENGAYALMEAMLLFQPFSFQSPDIIKQVVLDAFDFSGSHIEWMPLMLIKTYRGLEVHFLKDLVANARKFDNSKLRKIIWLIKSIDSVTQSFSFRSRLRSDSDYYDQVGAEREQVMEDSGTISLKWDESEAFHNVIKSKATDTKIALFTSFLIRYVLAHYFMIPFSSVKFRTTELVFMWRTILGHINFFISLIATKYDHIKYLIKGNYLKYSEDSKTIQ